MSLGHRAVFFYFIFLLFREDGSLSEWVIIELQGDLKHSTGDIKNAQFIGDLHFTESGVPILIIGVHVLYGKETSLSKPFAVLEKIKLNADDGEQTNMETDECENTTEYIVKAIVKRKLIFKGRPKPIVTDVPICT